MKCLSVCILVTNMCGGVSWGFPWWLHLKANGPTSKSASSPIPTGVPAPRSWQEPCSDRLSVWEPWPSCLPDNIEKSQNCLLKKLSNKETSKCNFFYSFFPPIFRLKDLKFDRAPWEVSVKWLRKLVIKQSCRCKLYLSRVRSSSSFGAQTGLGLRQVVTVPSCW